MSFISIGLATGYAMTSNSGLFPLTSDLSTSSSSGFAVQLSGLFSGIIPPIPDTSVMKSKPCRLHNLDVLQVTQAVVQINGHPYTSQMQANPIAVSTLLEGTQQAHED